MQRAAPRVQLEEAKCTDAMVRVSNRGRSSENRTRHLLTSSSVAWGSNRPSLGSRCRVTSTLEFAGTKNRQWLIVFMPLHKFSADHYINVWFDDAMFACSTIHRILVDCCSPSFELRCHVDRGSRLRKIPGVKIEAPVSTTTTCIRTSRESLYTIIRQSAIKFASKGNLDLHSQATLSRLPSFNHRTLLDMPSVTKTIIAIILVTAASALPTPQLAGEGAAANSIFSSTDNGIGYGIENAEDNTAALITSTKGGTAVPAAPAVPALARRQADKVAHGLQAVSDAAGTGSSTTTATNALVNLDGELTSGAANAGASVGATEESSLEGLGKAVPRL